MTKVYEAADFADVFAPRARTRAPKYALDERVAAFALELIGGGATPQAMSDRAAVLNAMSKFPPCEAEEAARAGCETEDALDARFRRIRDRLTKLKAALVIVHLSS